MTATSRTAGRLVRALRNPLGFIALKIYMHRAAKSPGLQCEHGVPEYHACAACTQSRSLGQREA